MGLLKDLLGLFSGGGERKLSEQLLFDKVIGFKGVVEGVGATTMLYNVAVALSENTKYRVCVIDTNMLYPCLFEMLGVKTGEDTTKGDIMDYARGTSLGKIVYDTKYNNIAMTGFIKRTVIDMVSVMEDVSLYDKLLAELKNFYDIILVDISHETTNFATESAIKCNKIFIVADLSLKCTSNIYNSLSYLATLGVSMSKCRRVILNKTESVNTAVKSTFNDLGIRCVGEIPFSRAIYVQGIKGRPFYGLATRDGGVTKAHIVLNDLLDDILEKTPLNEKYEGAEGQDDDFVVDGVNGIDGQSGGTEVVDGVQDVGGTVADASTVGVSDAVAEDIPTADGVDDEDFAPTYISGRR